MFHAPPVDPRPIRVPAEARPQLQVLPIGRVIDATVRRGGEDQLQAVAGRLRLPLPTGVALSPGDGVALRITQGAAGERGVELLIGPHREADALTRLQRINLPRQQPVAESVGRLAALPPEALPEPVARALRPLLASLPGLPDLRSAEGLRTALRDSGTLFESGLAARPELAAAMARGDLRAQLLRFAAALRGERGASQERGSSAAAAASGRAVQEAEEAVTGALARQMLHQLAAHQADGRVALSFELPVAYAGAIDALRVSIREEPGGGGHGRQGADTDGGRDTRWHVDIRLGFAGVGELEARLFYDSGGLGITWLANSDALRRSLTAEMPRLVDALAEAGIQVQGVAVSDRPPDSEAAGLAAGLEGLIDARA